jgi:hypothetical protein
MNSTIFTRDAPPYRVVAQCKWCEKMRPCDPRHLDIPRGGTLYYYICSFACEKAHESYITARFTDTPRPARPALAAAVVIRGAQINELRMLIKHWQQFASRILLDGRHRKRYQELQKRTEALLKNIKGE